MEAIQWPQDASQEIAAESRRRSTRPGEQWKKQMLEGASDLFTRGKKSNANEEVQAKEAELFPAERSAPSMETGSGLKKSSAAVMPRELRTSRSTHDHPEISIKPPASVSCWGCTITSTNRPTPVCGESTLRNHGQESMRCNLEDPCSGSAPDGGLTWPREGIRDQPVTGVRNLMRRMGLRAHLPEATHTVPR